MKDPLDISHLSSEEQVEWVRKNIQQPDENRASTQTSPVAPKPSLQELRQILLDLLTEYQTLAKPANPELLKLHIEAYEGKILTLVSQSYISKETIREAIGEDAACTELCEDISICHHKPQNRLRAELRSKLLEEE